MLTFIILASIAIGALFIGFFDIRIPFINANTIKSSTDLSENEIAAESSSIKDPVKRIEGFYRSVRAESWFHNIQLRQASEVA